MRDHAEPEPQHIGDEELVLLANAEASAERAAQVEAHLERCILCRGRLRELQQALEDFARLRRTELDPRIPPLPASRAELRRRLAADLPREGAWPDALRLEPRGLHLALVLTALLALAAAVTLTFRTTSDLPLAEGEPALRRSTPDPRLTPGLAAPLSRSEVCAANPERETATVGRSLALEVFRLYGVTAPEPGAYEIDYVIPPELGGRADVRNLWPQPYDALPWNAHAKDALEDYLVRSVCEGSVSVQTAQRELAGGWITAYQERFGAAEPLVEHAGFLRDEPWR